MIAESGCQCNVESGLLGETSTIAGLVRERCSGKAREFGQICGDFGAVGFEPGGKHEGGAEGFEGFVVGHAGRIGGDFVEDAAGFAEVDAVEIVSIDELGWSHSGGDEFFSPLGVVFIIFGAESNVVNDARAHTSVGGWVQV